MCHVFDYYYYYYFSSTLITYVGIWSVTAKVYDFITAWRKSLDICLMKRLSVHIRPNLVLSLYCIILASVPHDNADVIDVQTRHTKHFMCESQFQELCSHQSVDRNILLLLRNGEIYFHVHKCVPLDGSLSIISSAYIIHHAFQD